MKSEATAGGLQRKRAEIDEELRLAERRVAQLAGDLAALDATLRLFDPSAVLATTKPRLRRERQRQSRPARSLARVMDVLRQAGVPLTAREIATAAAARLGLEVETPRAMQRVVGQVRNVLARSRRGGEHQKRRSDAVPTQK